jgi:hypothetical protein
MDQILHIIEWTLLMGAPSALVLFRVSRMKREHEAYARRPFTELPLRVAGQSSRQKADEMFESATEDLLLILIGPSVGLFYGFVQYRYSIIYGGVLFVVVALVTGWLGFRLKGKLKECWKYRLGALGEQVVGRELDQLMRLDYRVFHDVQFVGWNIDHVVVGPRGVFAVETKTWRKPSKGSKSQAKIVFDGESLLLPGGRWDRKAIEQARNNARSLAGWISRAAAETVEVTPIIALPGWALDITRYGDVGVFSSTNIGMPMIGRGLTNLSPEQVQRITFQLARRCEESDRDL